MFPVTTNDLKNAAAEITAAVSLYNPVYEYRGREISDMISDFLQDYMPYVDDSVSDEQLEEWCSMLFRNARLLDSSLLKDNPYIKCIKVSSVQNSAFTLAMQSYRAGEILLYDMPLIMDGIPVPRLGCFAEDTSFPAVYENNLPWMSIVPSEIYSMQKDIETVSGRLLVLGLGLAYFPFMAAMKENVESVTVIECSSEITGFYEKIISVQFPEEIRNKIHVIQQDAYEYLSSMKEEYDYCYCDLWFGETDGHSHYRRLKKYETQYPKIRFLYWIEAYIK